MAEGSPKLQKLTLTVPEDLIKKAKYKALDNQTSISKVVTECLRRFVDSEQPVILRDTKSDYSPTDPPATKEG